MTDQLPRQRLSVRQHLSSELGRIAPVVWPASDDSPIASVDILDGLALQSDDPEILRAIAAAFTEAADSIDALTQNSEHYEVRGTAGPYDQESECACGAVFTAPTYDLLREVTDQHYMAAVA